MDLNQKMNEETALQCFGNGFDCSQVVLGHCAEKLGIPTSQALKTAAAFGGGMWRGDTCGCVAGALMAIGLKYGHDTLGDSETKNTMLARKAEFEERFRALAPAHGCLICREILGHDISIPEEAEKIMEEQLFPKVCAPLATGACAILDELLEADA